MIKTRTVEGIWQTVKDHIPQGRTVEILGALEDPDPANLRLDKIEKRRRSEGFSRYDNGKTY